jgi:hypothetical protein
MKPLIIALGGTVIAASIAALTGLVNPTCACGKELSNPSTQEVKLSAAPKGYTQVKPKPITPKDTQELNQILGKQNWIPTQSFRVNLVGFGNCLFVPVIDLKSNRLRLHLIQNRRIIYTFPELKQPKSWTPMDVRAVKFTELNFDGGDSDIILISEYTAGPSGPGTSPPFPVVLIYTTTEKGYEVDTKMSQILTQRQVRTVGEAEKILREEFNFLP